MRREYSSSCGAAIRVKPRARLCEPWYQTIESDRAPKGRLRSRLADVIPLSPPRGSANLTGHYPRLAKPHPGLNSDRCSAACLRRATNIVYWSAEPGVYEKNRSSFSCQALKAHFIKAHRPVHFRSQGLSTMSFFNPPITPSSSSCSALPTLNLFSVSTRCLAAVSQSSLVIPRP